MSSRCRARDRITLACATLIACALAGCEREQREFQIPPGKSAPPSVETGISPIVGGNTDYALRERQQHEFGDNAYQVSQGKNLYGSFNCYGCHAWGGGDIGPPLMDEQWIYGGEIDQIYLSIAQGRANGMPAFAGRIAPEQIWQLAAFVRSMSGEADKSVRPGRDDHLRTPSPQEAKPKAPVSGERED
jgi:cytochrome c oxidase cbb3-type subunit III